MAAITVSPRISQTIVKNANGSLTVLGASGNARGVKAVDLQQNPNGTTQVASGQQSVVLGGDGNTSSGYGSLTAGSLNTASGYFSIAIGYGNTASGGYSSASGSYCTSSSDYSFTFGKSNTASGNYGIAMGEGNTAGELGVAMGNDNIAGKNCATFGGTNITSSSYFSFAAGFVNTISSSYHSMAIGASNTISGGYCSVALGSNNQVTSPGQMGIAFGAGNTVSSSYGFALGQANTASGYLSSSYGLYAKSISYGQIAKANGRFNADGDAQISTYVFYGSTGDNTPKILKLDNSSEAITLASGQVLSAIINITGVDVAGGNVAQFVRKTLLQNDSGTTTVVGTQIIGTDITSGIAAATWTVAIGTSSNNLDITVTGALAETVRWVARVEAVDMNFES